MKLAKLEQDAAMAALQARVRPTGAQDLGDQGAAALTHFVFVRKAIGNSFLYSWAQQAVGASG